MGLGLQPGPPAEAVNPRDSLFRAVRPRFARRISLRTESARRGVWRKTYAHRIPTWMLLGEDSARQRAACADRQRRAVHQFESPSHLVTGLPHARARRHAVRRFGDRARPRQRDSPRYDPHRRRQSTAVPYPGFDQVRPVVRLGDFHMDRFEVTNREYRRFVDSGGYRRRDLWEYPFVKDGKSLSWDAAIALMTDRSGRTGPSTWEGGDYPQGQDDHPVAGVSWYEAAAYAKFSGKSLPTIFHWGRAATIRNSATHRAAQQFLGPGNATRGRQRRDCPASAPSTWRAMCVNGASTRRATSDSFSGAAGTTSRSCSPMPLPRLHSTVRLPMEYASCDILRTTRTSRSPASRSSVPIGIFSGRSRSRMPSSPRTCRCTSTTGRHSMRRCSRRPMRGTGRGSSCG